MDNANRDDPLDSTRELPGADAGFKIGEYRIVRSIGEGGMGQVFLATDNLNRHVALKLLSQTLAQDVTMRSRFIEEGKCQASINHPNVASVFAAGDVDGRQFIAMEFIEGKTLKELISEKLLEFDAIREIFGQVCHGLQAAHEAGVIHRDIKPGNVMVDHHGRARILDFGLAKTETSTRHTLPGGRVGTVAYMSPEQAQGKKLDVRSDIFSLGIMLFEMTTRHKPFSGTNDISVLFSLSHDPHPDPQSIRPEIPDLFLYIINRSLQKLPAKRFASVAELLEYLEGRRKVAWEPGIGDGEQKVSIAVLPFDNQGSEVYDYFATGIAEEICAQLAKQRKLKVIAYNSSRLYAHTDKSIPQICSELGVSHLVCGSLQLAGTEQSSVVKVSARLIADGENGVNWQDSYVRLADQIFAVQEEVARSVVNSLGVVFGEANATKQVSGETASLEAYDFFLRANELFPRSLGQDDIAKAIQLYEDAAAHDPRFALAHARLARAHLSMYWFHYDHSPERLALAQDAINAALAITPDLPEAKQAIGFYQYYGKSDYAAALRTFEEVEQNRPNDAGVIASQAFINRRLGNWSEALTLIEKASALDPRSALFTYERANTLMLIRRYDEAIKYLERCQWVAPEWSDLYVKKAMCFILKDWDLSAAVQVFHEAAAHFNPTELAVEWILFDVLVEYFEGDLNKAIENLWVDEGEKEVYFIVKARLCKRMGQEQLAREHYMAASEILDTKLTEDPSDARYWIHHGITNAGLGNYELALESGRKAVDLVPFEKDHVSSVYFMELLSLIYTMVGEHDDAIGLLRKLLLVPSNFSLALLRNFSEFAPLRQCPGFAEMIK